MLLPSPTIILEAAVVGLLLGGVYGALTMGLSVILGVLKIVNFAQADFMMLGMYFAFLLPFDPILVFLIAIPVFFGLGVLLEYVAINRVVGKPDVSQLLMTLGISIVLQNMALSIWGPDPLNLITAYRSEVVSLGPFTLGVAQLIAFGLSVVIAVSLTLVLSRTDYGRVVRATVNDRETALLMGVDVRRIYAVMFGVGVALASSAGVLLAMYYPAFPTVGNNFVLIMFLAVMLGGLGNAVGALLAGLAIGVTQSVATLFLPSFLSLLPVYLFFIVALFALRR